MKKLDNIVEKSPKRSARFAKHRDSRSLDYLNEFLRPNGNNKIPLTENPFSITDNADHFSNSNLVESSKVLFHTKRCCGIRLVYFTYFLASYIAVSIYIGFFPKII